MFTLFFFINCVYDRGQRWLTYTQWIRKKLSCDRQAGKTSQKTTAGGRELGTRGGRSLAVVIDDVENGFQYQFESAMVCQTSVLHNVLKEHGILLSRPLPVHQRLYSSFLRSGGHSDELLSSVPHFSLSPLRWRRNDGFHPNSHPGPFPLLALSSTSFSGAAD